MKTSQMTLISTSDRPFPDKALPKLGDKVDPSMPIQDI